MHKFEATVTGSIAYEPDHFFSDGIRRCYWIHDPAIVINKLLDMVKHSKDIDFIVSFSWYQSEQDILNLKSAIKDVDFNRIIFLFNSDYECSMARFYLAGHVVLRFNNSATLDANIFKYQESMLKYDLVVSSKLEPFKNVEIADPVKNKALITYNSSFIDTIGSISYDYVFSDITPEKVSSILNTGIFGGIFSFSEGACYTSLEYLLCGLTVISTKSLGGRDFFYNEKNSIILTEDLICKLPEIIMSYKTQSSNPVVRREIAEDAYAMMRNERCRLNNGLALFFSNLEYQMNFNLDDVDNLGNKFSNKRIHFPIDINLSRE